MNLFYTWLIFRPASTTLRNVEKLNALNGGDLKTKGALCLWECTLIAVRTLKLTDYALSLGYIYIVAREVLDMKIRRPCNQDKYNEKIIDSNNSTNK